jgi:leucyl aminopeptidase
MQYYTTTSAASRRAAACIIVGIYEKGKLGHAAENIDNACGGDLSRLIKSGDIAGDLGACQMLNSLQGVKTKRVLIVGLGNSADFGIRQYRKAHKKAIDYLKKTKVQDIVTYLTLEDVAQVGTYYLARYAVETIGNALYSYSETKSKRAPKVFLKDVGLATASRGQATQCMAGAAHADAIVDGMTIARDLGNLPPNVCTPSYLARTAQKLGRQHSALQTRVLGEAEIRKLGMRSFLSVTDGTSEPAKLIVMQYKGARKEDPIVLVGKGITFDSGGISLKSGPGMDEMKFDMCGAATVIATMAVVAKLKLPINVNAIVPTCENLPSSTATKPGDVVKSMAGKTIEILNTDAEGRLILCDALTYAKRFRPRKLIDVATLTGACVIALGHHTTAIMSNSDEMAASIKAAGDTAGDRAWQLPMGEDYARQLRSNFADLANVGGRDAGAITAACFLANFVDDCDWAHLDIAGTAWLSGARKGATGRPVPLLSEYLMGHAGVLP